MSLRMLVMKLLKTEIKYTQMLLKFQWILEKDDKEKQASNKHYDYKPLTNACR